MTTASTHRRQLAYYSADWIWPNRLDSEVKALLLYFDGIALSLTADIASETVVPRSELAQALASAGLLFNFDPRAVLNKSEARTLNSSLRAAVSGLLDEGWQPPIHQRRRTARRLGILGSHWGATHHERYHELTNGPTSVPRLDPFFRLLRKNGLAAQQDLHEVAYIEATIRSIILFAYARALQRSLSESQIDLHPFSSKQDGLAFVGGYRSLGRFLKTTGRPYSALDDLAAQFLSDIDAVDPDFSRVPLDELLDFRARYGNHYRTYASNLRTFVLQQSLLPSEIAAEMAAERREEIRDAAADLRRYSRSAFGLHAAETVLTLAGVTWSTIQGDPVTGILTGMAALTGVTGEVLLREDKGASMYSYLLRISSL